MFLSLGKHYEGFQRRNDTPYMHILVYHIPEMVERLGSIKSFSGQGKFYFVYVTHYFSSNKHDAAKEILVAEVRLEELMRGNSDRESCMRQKCKYVKSDTRYWVDGIRTSRRSASSSTTTAISTTTAGTSTSTCISTTIAGISTSISITTTGISTPISASSTTTTSTCTPH